MGKFFGTDGIRGVPWNYPFTEDFISRIAYCAASALTRHRKPEDGVPSIFIGMDTRASAQKIRKYLCEGFRAACGKAGRPKVVNIGIIPTPAISYIVQKEKADFGVVISASHNPPEFNGIKFFGPDGRKLNDELEQEIESMLLSEQPVKFRKAFPQMAKKDFSSEYIDFLLSTLPEGFNLKGVKLVVDCANGAATKIAPKVFEKLGAETVFVGNHPNGNNINIRCGALHTDRIAEATPSAHAFCGISLDGDADRCLFCDECGNKMDGDDVIAAVAPFLKERGRLTNNGVSVTYMSNLGLIKFLESKGIRTEQVPVGDKNVTDALERLDYKIGGETSGHTVFREFFPTGDGLLTALQTLVVARSCGKPFSAIRGGWKRYPQYLKSVKVSEKPPLENVKGLKKLISDIESKIDGRVFIRYSGTEPLLRLLVEGENNDLVQAAGEEILKHYSSNSAAVAE